ncbi:hypothetical protein [Algibacter sp. PT7-4]
MRLFLNKHILNDLACPYLDQTNLNNIEEVSVRVKSITRNLNQF